MAIINDNNPFNKPFYHHEDPADKDDNQPLVKEIVLTDWISGSTFIRELDLKKVDATEIERIDTLMREAIAEKGFYILGIAVTQPKDEGERGFYHYDGKSLKDRITHTFKNIDTSENVDEALFLRVDGVDGNYDYIGSETALFSKNTAVSALFNIYLNVEDELPKAYYDLASCYERKNKSSKLSPEKKAHYLKQQLHYFKLSAERGYPQAHNKLANVYIEVGQYENAIPFLERSIEQGSSDATYLLAKLYFEKILDQREKCLALFERILKLNDRPPARVSYYIGTCYLKGIGTEIDIQKALGLLEEASKANVPEAKHELALFYFSKADFPKAAEYFASASKSGNTESEFRLALMHFNGQLEPKTSCFAILKSLAEKSKFTKAYFYLAYCYEQGVGCEKSSKDAKTYYEKAAEQKDPKAVYRLTLGNFDGLQVTKEYNQAQKLFAKVVNEDETNARAFFLLAKNYDKTQNPQKAIECYTESAQLGHGPAIYILGKAYYEGSYGLNKSLEDAERLLLKATSHEGVPYILAKIYEEKNQFTKAIEAYKSLKNHPECLFRLYQIYSQGLCGVEKSDKEALNYLKKAAQKEHLVAKSLLEEMKKRERPFTKWDEWENYFDAEGILYNCDIPPYLLPKIKESAEGGRVQDQYNLALLYIQGSATIRINNIEGQKWLKLSLKQDFPLSYILQGKLFDPFDRFNAKKCFLKALPHPEASFLLSTIYAMPNERRKDPTKTLDYLADARAGGYLEAMYATALLHLEAKNIKEGLALLNEAKDKGCFQSSVFLADCYAKDNFGLGFNPKKAFHLYMEGANRNDFPSIYMAARCYEKGFGVKQSKQKADQLFAKLHTSDAYKLYRLSTFLSTDNSSLIEKESLKEYLFQAARRGLIYALRTIALWYDNGTFFEQNAQKAYEYWKAAADLDDGYALYKVAVAHKFRYGFPPDNVKAKMYYLKAADKGLAEAMTAVGLFYSSGECNFEVNQEIATEYLKKSAEQGHGLAMYNLAYRYLNGQGVERNSAKFVEWMKNAADENLGIACFALGECFKNGAIDLPINIQESIKFFEKGLRLNVPNCAYKLAEIYGFGIGGKKIDYEIAKKYLTMEVEKVEPKALTLLGTLLYHGQWNYPRNDENAVYYWSLAASKGDHEAMYHLAKSHARGTGTPQNPELAKMWFEKAASNNHRGACYELGKIFHLGKGVPIDEQQAAKWYQKGADLGDVDSSVCLATFLLRGKGGLPVNIPAGKELLLKAAEKGDAIAHHNLALFYSGMAGNEKDKTKFLHHMMIASELGHTPAMVDLGYHLYKKQKSQDDVDQAIKLFSKAMEKGNPAACLNLGRIYWNEDGAELAFKCFEAGAKLNNSECIFELAKCYEDGIGTPINLELAKLNYLKAADMQLVEAMEHVGSAYDRGESGFEKDLTKGFEWTLKAAELGSPRSIYNTAVNYFRGYGVETDYVKAIEYFKKSKDPRAHYCIGYFYLAGVTNVEKNIEEALKFFNKGASLKEIACLLSLAKIYIKGELGIPADLELGKKYLLEALELEHVEAYHFAGFLYQYGKYGFETDYAKGIEFLTKAADKGSGQAMAHLGEAHKYGYGVEKSGTKALYWYQKAVENNNWETYKDIGLLYLEGTDDIEKDEKKAFENFKAGADHAVPFCTFKVAECYEKGIGVDANAELAKEWNLKAVEQKPSEGKGDKLLQT